MIDVKSHLEQINKLTQEIYEHFDHQESWHVSPLENNLDLYWVVVRDTLYCSSEPFSKESIENGPEYCFNIIRGQISRADHYTMIHIDTQCDRNQFLSIFDNAKEEKDSDIIKLISEW